MSSVKKILAGILFFVFLNESALSQINPIGVVARAITTTMDVRTKAEVTADAEISAGISKRLLEDKKSEWAGVSALVFARHVVLAGAVKSEDVKKRVEAVAKRDPKIRSLKNELRVGDVGKLVNDTKLDAEINAKLTAAKGVGSVNMRWKTTGGRTVVMGVAQSQQEAGLVLRTIRAVEGVTGVVSQLRVVAGKK